MPVTAVQIHDNWQVMGLQGTGSCDFSVTDLFVPERFSWDVQQARPQRGGPLYRLGMPAFVTNEHVAFALGVGRRALDTLLDLAQSKQRGYGQRSTLATRPAVHRRPGGRGPATPRGTNPGPGELRESLGHRVRRPATAASLAG